MIIILLDAHEQYSVPSLLIAFANCGIGAVLGVIIINLVYQWCAENDTEEALQDALVQILTGDNHRLLRKLYNNQAIRSILQNCIESYCCSASLSKNYLRYIENSCRILKKKEIYNVTLSEEQGHLYLHQELTDTRCFRDPRHKFSRARIQVKSYLVLKRPDPTDADCGELDRIMNDHSYFFREEISDSELLAYIKGLSLDKSEPGRPGFHRLPADEAAGVIARLQYRVNIERAAHARTDSGSRKPYLEGLPYEVFVDTGDPHRGCPGVRGIEISVDVPDEGIDRHPEEFQADGYIQYTAELTIKYPTEQETTFYSIYAAPTLGAEFRLIFDPSVRVDMKSVSYMTFISFAEDEDKGHAKYDGQIRINGRNLEFKTSRTIFPRSGISISWNQRC